MVGLTGSPDITHMDIGRDDTRAIGYMGKSPSVAWAERPADAILTGDPTGVMFSSYHTEDADVDFATTHKAYPIVDKFNLTRRYNQFDRSSAGLTTEDVIWLGTLNTISAIDLPLDLPLDPLPLGAFPLLNDVPLDNLPTLPVLPLAVSNLKTIPMKHSYHAKSNSV